MKHSNVRRIAGGALLAGAVGFALADGHAVKTIAAKEQPRILRPPRGG
jgi:hypothetical protein